MYNETMVFVTKNNILCKVQLGFRKFHSTDFCLAYLQDKAAKESDSRLLSGMILIDLQKFFDTIDHKILIKSILLSISISKHAYIFGIEPKLDFL